MVCDMARGAPLLHLLSCEVGTLARCYVMWLIDQGFYESANSVTGAVSTGRNNKLMPG